MNYGKKHDLPFGIMDVAGLLRLNIRRRAPGQVYVDCPICGDRRGKMNLNTEKDLWRCNYCGEGGGMLSLYAKVYGVSNSDAYREICDALAVNGFSPDYTVSEKTTPAEAEQSDAASVQEVHQTLSMLLSMLTLIPAHHTHLQSVRGLSDDEITRFGFKSTPPPFLCRSLTNRLVKAGCRVQGVPGFYVDDNGCWTVKFHQRTSGIIIPIFGVDGLIRGAQIRLDHPLKDKDDPPEKTGVKYLTLSSTGKRMGTTSGSPIHFVGDPCSRVVYVTEGCLKADVAHALMHRTFVATLGANNTAKLDGLFAFLHRNGTEEIIEAEDMDKYSNEMVGKGASKIYALAARHGMRCRRLTWNPNYKGIDDWQLALRRKEQKMKEDRRMTFKEQYLNGLCGLEMLEACTEKWHAMKEDSKLMPEDIEPQENKKVVQECVGVTCTKLSSPWTVYLSTLIAAHYCCRPYRSSVHGSKVSEIGFIGMEDDFKLCKLAFLYAYDCVASRCRQIRTQKGYPAKTLREMCNSYGWGFCRGLSAAFQKQEAEHQEWGLVMVVPQAVEDAVSKMKRSSYKISSTSSMNRQYAAMGYADGQEFDMHRRLEPSA